MKIEVVLVSAMKIKTILLLMSASLLGTCCEKLPEPTVHFNKQSGGNKLEIKSVASRAIQSYAPVPIWESRIVYTKKMIFNGISDFGHLQPDPEQTEDYQDTWNVIDRIDFSSRASIPGPTPMVFVVNPDKINQSQFEALSNLMRKHKTEISQEFRNEDWQSLTGFILGTFQEEQKVNALMNPIETQAALSSP